VVDIITLIMETVMGTIPVVITLEIIILVIIIT
jgi:hypothetical protein